MPPPNPTSNRGSLTASIAQPLAPVERAFDATARVWHTRRARQLRAATIATVFILGIVIVELKRRNAFEGTRLDGLPISTTHLAAISTAVTVLLIFELVDLVISLARSVAGALAAQLDIYALILLRDAFLPLAEFDEPISLSGTPDAPYEDLTRLGAMASDAAGAIALFLLTTVYRKLQRHVPITDDPTSQATFVRIKKLIGLTMLGVLIALIGADAGVIAVGDTPIKIFDIFFTILIFVDVLLAIVSLGFSNRHAVVFRNFGFAFVAVLLRLALAADVFQRPALAIIAGGFAIAITYAYNRSFDQHATIESATPDQPAGEQPTQPNQT